MLNVNENTRRFYILKARQESKRIKRLRDEPL